MSSRVSADQPAQTRRADDMVRRGLTSERLIGLFLFGIVLFTPPLLGIFNKPRL